MRKGGTDRKGKCRFCSSTSFFMKAIRVGNGFARWFALTELMLFNPVNSLHHGWKFLLKDCGSNWQRMSNPNLLSNTWIWDGQCRLLGAVGLLLLFVLMADVYADQNTVTKPFQKWEKPLASLSYQKEYIYTIKQIEHKYL